MRKIRLFLFLLLGGGWLSGQAQHLLLVQKSRSPRKYEFATGEFLQLKMQGGRQMLSGEWEKVDDQTIQVQGQAIALSGIRWVRVGRKEKGVWLLVKSYEGLGFAGLGFLAVSYLNHLIAPGDFPLERKVYGVSGRLVASALVCRGLDRTLRPRKVRPGRRYGIYLRP